MHPIANFKVGLNTQNAIHCALYNPMIGRIFENNGVEILVFISPSGYRLASFGFPLLNWVYSINSSKMIGSFPAVLNFNRLFLKLNRFMCNKLPVLPHLSHSHMRFHQTKRKRRPLITINRCSFD